MNLLLILVPPALFLLLWFRRSHPWRIFGIAVILLLFLFEALSLEEAPRTAVGLYFEATGQFPTDGVQQGLSITHFEIRSLLPPLVSAFFSLAAMALLTRGRKDKETGTS